MENVPLPVVPHDGNFTDTFTTGLSVEEKAVLFDTLIRALTHRWQDGSWSWWCLMPPGGPKRITRAEAVADLCEWANRVARKKP